ncbi:hypothetical protein [Nocardia thraciensis]
MLRVRRGRIRDVGDLDLAGELVGIRPIDEFIDRFVAEPVPRQN